MTATAPTSAAALAVHISLRKVSKRFGRRRVLDGVSMDATNGGVFGIGGPNGSGKSTLIRIVAGLLTPDAGTAEVRLAGRSLDRIARRAVIGWVSPDVGLYPSLTGAEHVRLYAALRGLSLSAHAVAEALERVGLDSHRRDIVRAYSSGMRQRLRFACATVHRPAILLLDEPFATLDSDGVAVVRELVQAQRHVGVTVIAGNDSRELDLADEVLTLGARC